MCREMLRLTRNFLHGAQIEFMSMPPFAWMGAFKDCNQKHIDFYIEPKDLVQSLDDFADKILLPCAYSLAELLKKDGIQFSYELPLPRDHVSARFNYDGLCMRLIMEPRVDEGRTRALEGEEPDSYFLRFDVLYSHLPIDLKRERVAA